jgi:serine/threonine protein phosphatase 1
LKKWFKRILDQPEAKPESYFVEKPGNQGRRLVISDIHGCTKTFEALLHWINLTRKDQLFLLGDYIDRGPDSSGVLDIIIGMMEDGYNIFPLRGNHEQMVMDKAALDGSEEVIAYLENNNSEDLIGKNKKVRSEYLKFFHRTAYYFELDKFYLVHAGFDFKARDPLAAYEEMLWIRQFEPSDKILRGKTLIHGHTPYLLDVIKEAVAHKSQVIPLDNGCVFHGENKYLGNLLCLDLDTFELFVQENKDYIAIDDEYLRL